MPGLGEDKNTKIGGVVWRDDEGLEGLPGFLDRHGDLCSVTFFCSVSDQKLLGKVRERER